VDGWISGVPSMGVLMSDILVIPVIPDKTYRD
jgi:hypothetical protein